jgi:hypothetical protein
MGRRSAGDWMAGSRVALAPDALQRTRRSRGRPRGVGRLGRNGAREVFDARHRWSPREKEVVRRGKSGVQQARNRWVPRQTEKDASLAGEPSAGDAKRDENEGSARKPAAAPSGVTEKGGDRVENERASLASRRATFNLRNERELAAIVAQSGAAFRSENHWACDIWNGERIDRRSRFGRTKCARKAHRERQDGACPCEDGSGVDAWHGHSDSHTSKRSADTNRSRETRAP